MIKEIIPGMYDIIAWPHYGFVFSVNVHTEPDNQHDH